MKALKIVNCSDGLLWYCGYVGAVVPVKYNGSMLYGEYTSIEPSGYTNIVKQRDAELVEVPNDFTNYYNKDVKMKPKIKVFPDYCSSGLWDAETGASIDERKFESLLGKSNLLALKYWHCLWEFNIACFEDGEQPRASASFIAEWNEDGKELVKQFNLCQDQFEFVYEEC